MKFLRKKNEIEMELDRIYLLLTAASPESELYKTLVDRAATLIELADKTKKKIRPEYIAVFGNIALAMLIVWYEKTDITTSKAWSLVSKGRV